MHWWESVYSLAQHSPVCMHTGCTEETKPLEPYPPLIPVDLLGCLSSRLSLQAHSCVICSICLIFQLYETTNGQGRGSHRPNGPHLSSRLEIYREQWCSLGRSHRVSRFLSKSLAKVYRCRIRCAVFEVVLGRTSDTGRG